MMPAKEQVLFALHVHWVAWQLQKWMKDKSRRRRTRRVLLIRKRGRGMESKTKRDAVAVPLAESVRTKMMTFARRRMEYRSRLHIGSWSRSAHATDFNYVGLCSACKQNNIL